MAGDSLGGLLVKISGDMSELKTAFDKSTYLVEQSYDRMARAGDKLIGSFKAIAVAAGVGFSVVAIKNMAEQAIRTADALDDLTEKVGGSAAAWSGLIDSARISGIAFETMEMGAVRLSRAMAGSEVETKGSSKAFEFLGVSVRDASGNMRATEQVMVDVARALDQYQDGAGKAALAQDLFGKGGAALLPALKQIAQEGARVGSVTDEMAKSADAYSKDLVRLAIAKESLARVITFQMLPAVNAVVTAMTEMSKQTDSANGAAKAMAADGSLAEWGWNVAKAIAVMIDAMKSALTLLKAFPAAAQIFVEGIASAAVPFGEQIAALYKMTDAGKAWAQSSEEARAKWKAALEDTSKSMLDLIRLQQQAAEAMKLTGPQYLDARDLRANPALKPSAGGYTSGGGAAGRAAKDLQDTDAAYQTLIRSITEKTAAMERELAGLDKLTDADKLALDTMLKIQDGTLKLTEAQKIRVTAELELLLAGDKTLKQKALQAALDKAELDIALKLAAETKKFAAEIQAVADAYTKRFQDANAVIEQIRFETTLIGLSNEERTKAIALRALETNGIQLSAEALKVFSDRLKQALNDQAAAANNDAINQFVKTQTTMIANMAFENTLIGLTNAERDKAIALRVLETSKLDQQSEAYAKLSAALKAAFDERSRLLDLRNAQAELAGMTNSLTDALLDAFENGKSGAKAFLEWMKAEFLKTVLRPQIQAFLTPVASAVQSVFGGLSTSLSGSGGLLSAFSSFFGGGGVSGYGGAGDPGGFSPADRSLSNNTLPALFERYFGQGGNVTTALSGIVLGLGVGGAIASALGHGDTHKDATAILSVVGAIVDLYFGGSGIIGGAVGGAVGGIFDSMNEGDIERTARVGQGPGNYTYGSTGGPFGDIGIQRFSDRGFSDTEMAQTLRSWFQAIGKLDQEVARHFSADEISRATTALAGQGIALNLGLEHTALDPETASNIIRTRFGTIFGVIDQQMADLVTNFKGSGEELITLVVDLATVHDRLTALHAEFSTLFGEDISFAQLADLKGETEGYSEALQRLAGEFAVTNQIAQMLGETQEEVWGAIGLASEGARAHLIELAGGLDALSEQLDYYYTHFYTTAEQQAQTQRTLAQAFADAGVAMPRTIDGFRAITDHFLGMGEAGAQAAATMLALAPSFYAYIGAIEAVDAVITTSGQSLVALFGQQVITTEMIAAMQRNGEALTATLTRVTSEFAATNDLLAMFGLTSEQVFGAFGLASEAARAKLIELSGGLDKFTANLSSFYQNYFTQTERNQRSLGSLQGTFAALGLAMPTTLEGFRNLVEGQLALGPAGAAAAAALLAIQQQFYDLYQPITDAAAAIGGLARVVRGPAVDDLGRAAAEAHENLMRLNDALRDSFRDAYRSIEMAGLSNQQQYEYLQREAAGFVTNLQAAGTGEDVQMWAEKIRADMLSAFNLLDPAEQDARRQEFLDNLLQVQEMATTRLAALDPTGSLGSAAVEPATAAAEAQSNAASTQREAAAMQKQAAADMQEAAKAMLLAQQLIKRIQIDLPSQGMTVEAGA